MQPRSSTWIHPPTDARIAAHVHDWQATVRQLHTVPLGVQPFVTISREYGCGAYNLARHLTQLLNERLHPPIPWLAYGRGVLEQVAQDLHLQREIVESIMERRRDEITELFDSLLNHKVDEALVFRKLAEVIRSLAMRGRVVLVGRGGNRLTPDLKTGLHVRLVAPRAWRVHHVQLERRLTEREASALVAKSEAERAHFLETFFVQDPAQPVHFDLTIDCSRFDPAQVAEIIFCALSVRFHERLAED